MVEHCLDALPNEGCGLVAISGDLVTGVYPTTNADASPTRYAVPPDEHYSALRRAESVGWGLGGAFHSHPGGRPVPSPRDLESALDPQWVYLIVGLAARPQVRAWEIRRGTAREVPLVEV
jgi:[CysO sulfur-carrier protein]-S-L-cysteine hydrolase